MDCEGSFSVGAFRGGEPRGSWSLVCAIQAESRSPRTRLSFEQKELWEKIALACDWLVNF